MRRKFLKIAFPVAIIVQTIILSSVARAGAVTPFVRSTNGVQVLDFTAIQTCQQAYDSTNVSYLPNKMSSVKSSDSVARDIINYNVKKLFNKPQFKGLNKQAKNLAEGFSSDYKSTSGYKLSFKFKAIHAKAEVVYKGSVNAKLSFKLDSKSLNLEVSKNLTGRTQLVYTHNDKTKSRSDLLALRYSF